MPWHDERLFAFVTILVLVYIYSTQCGVQTNCKLALFTNFKFQIRASLSLSLATSIILTSSELATFFHFWLACKSCNMLLDIHHNNSMYIIVAVSSQLLSCHAMPNRIQLKMIIIGASIHLFVCIRAIYNDSSDAPMAYCLRNETMKQEMWHSKTAHTNKQCMLCGKLTIANYLLANHLHIRSHATIIPHSPPYIVQTHHWIHLPVRASNFLHAIW